MSHTAILQHRASHYIICVPKSPNILFHFFPCPALALDGSSSSTFAPYCLIQQLNALLLTGSMGGDVSWLTELLAISTSDWRLLDVEGRLDRGASLSSSLSKFGCSPAFRNGCGSDDSGSSEDVGEDLRVANACCSKSADLCSSRLPHSMQSCSLSSRRTS